MPTSLKDLRAATAFQYYPPVFPVQGNPPKPPLNVKATGKEGYIIVQWKPTGTADSYQVAIMSDQNLAAPNQGVVTVAGGQTSRYEYHVGNVVLTRYFAVRSLNAQAVSEFSSIVSAASALTGGAGAAEPAAPFNPNRPGRGGSTRWDEGDEPFDWDEIDDERPGW